MADSYFVALEGTDSGGWFAPGPATAGPWDPRLQHGGPPNALAVAVAERVLADRTGRADLRASRLAADFVGPVPVADVLVAARVVRAARSAALVEATVSAAGRDCLLARVWFVRDTDTAAVAAAPVAAAAPPGPPAPLDVGFAFGQSLEWHFTSGRMSEAGPAAAWVRPTLSLLGAGYEWSGLARAVLVADSGNGISAELDWSQWSFMNVDLDVHLARPVEGEWLYLDAATQVGTHGAAVARSTLADVRGVVGAGLQTLVLKKVPAAGP